MSRVYYRAPFPRMKHFFSDFFFCFTCMTHWFIFFRCDVLKMWCSFLYISQFPQKIKMRCKTCIKSKKCNDLQIYIQLNIIQKQNTDCSKQLTSFILFESIFYIYFYIHSECNVCIWIHRFNHKLGLLSRQMN